MEVRYIDAKGLAITPGLIDQHIHGGYGVDFNKATVEDIAELAKNLLKHGITSVVATIMTDSEENIRKQINEISLYIENQPKNAAQIQGIHLEGPFLNPDFKGIHPDSQILLPTVSNYLKFDNKNMKIVSYAPEFDNNFEFAGYLSGKNIVLSAGHCNSAAGAKQVTHLFNAMPPLHHRNPGIIGEALTNDNISVEVIADNEHLHPTIINLILKAKPKSKIIFISDSLPLNRSLDDHIIFGGQEIFRRDEKAVNENGTFAGSLSFLDDNLRKNTDKISFSDFLIFASQNPAKNLGLSTKGFIDRGFDADLVFWDENLQVKQVFISGLLSY